jgi:hypothetical protein
MNSWKHIGSIGFAIAGACVALSASCASAQESGPTGKDALKFDGAVRMWVEMLSWNDQRKGTPEFDTARLGFRYDDGRFLAAGRERYYHYTRRQTGASKGADMLFNEYLWGGYRFADQSELHLGQDRVPFGLLPYASHNFFESIAWYAGYEDTYAMGAHYQRRIGDVNADIAFFPSDGRHLLAWTDSKTELDGLDSVRYSNHLMKSYGRVEKNTFVARLAYPMPVAGGKMEIGASFLAGQLAATNPALTDGTRRAEALHMSGEFGNFGIQLETIKYANRFDGNGSIAGNWYGACNNDCVLIGAFGFTNRLAARAHIDIANLSYKIPGSIGPFSNFVAYNDWSRVRKSAAGYADSYQNVTGISFGAGGWFIMVDVAHAANQPYLSPVFGAALAAGGTSRSSGHRFNANIGYYF